MCSTVQDLNQQLQQLQHLVPSVCIDTANPKSSHSSESETIPVLSVKPQTELFFRLELAVQTSYTGMSSANLLLSLQQCAENGLTLRLTVA